MKKNYGKSLISCVITISMLLSLGGCGSKPTPTKDTTAKSTSQQLITLKYTGDFKGMTNNMDEVTQEIKRLTNVQLEYVDANEDKYKLLMASNDLGDITHPVNQTISNMVKS